MDNFKIADMYNNEKMTLKEIGEKLGLSKSTVQRRLTQNGWHFDKESGKYKYTIDELQKEKRKNNENFMYDLIKKNSKELSELDRDEEINEVNEENSNRLELVDKIPTSEQMVNRTYAIPERIDRAIRIKGAIEGKKPIDIIRKALEDYIEDKYKNM